MRLSKLIESKADSNVLVRKYPDTFFADGAQLVVQQSQEALFIADGRVSAVFGPGFHTLETAGNPQGGFLQRIGVRRMAALTGALYFVDKTEKTGVPWGTDSKIQYLDPVYNFPVAIGACGEMRLRAENAAEVILKIVGTEEELTQRMLVRKLRALIMKHVKSVVPDYILENRISIFELDRHLTALSEKLQDVLSNEFENYGLRLSYFSVMTIVLPEEDPGFVKFRELHYRRVNDIAEALLNQRVDLINQETRDRKTVMQAEALAKKWEIESGAYRQAAPNGTYGNKDGTMNVLPADAVSGLVRFAKTCVRCGHVFTDDADVCPECGRKRETEDGCNP